jgi:hypothetical protein
MAAQTQDVIRRSRGTASTERAAIATSSTVYVGSLLARRNTTGRALAATAATGRRVLGVAVQKVGAQGPGGGTGVGVAGGTEYVKYEYGNEHLFTIKTAIRTNTSLGLNVFVIDDQTVGGTAAGTAAARVNAGRLVAFEASDKSTGWVAVAVFGPTNIAV